MWNCKGALKPNSQDHVHDLIRQYDPAIFVVMETRIGGARARDISNKLPSDDTFHTNTIGRKGGLWLLWDLGRVEVSHLASSKQEIHSTIKVHASSSGWLLSAAYASPRSAERCVLWNNLSNVAELHNMP